MCDSRPNIVLIMTDQQRADFLASEGFPLNTMPFVDSLAGQGVGFRRAYTPNPTCVPARCSMLTGRFPKATRVRLNGGIENMYRTPDLLDILRQAGYSVNLSGKNHSHRNAAQDFDFASEYHHSGVYGRHVRNDQEQAFDAWMQTLHHGISHTCAPFPIECQYPYRVVRDAIRWLEQRDASRPFFLWLSFPEPHSPYQVPEPYFSLFPEATVGLPATTAEDGARKGPKWRWLQWLIRSKHPGYLQETARYRANYCGMLRFLDEQIKRFIEYLRKANLYENTLLIYCSDHGDYCGEYGLQRKGVGLPEVLVRVPLFFTGPGIVAQEKRQEFVSLVDIFPTICDMLGVEIPYGVQGRSLRAILRGSDARSDFSSIYAELGFGGEHYGEDERPKMYYPYEGPEFNELNCVTQSGKLKMLRMGSWKLLFDHEGHGELYDLCSDPMELNDRWNDPGCSSQRQRLVEELLRWTIRTEDDLPAGPYQAKRPAPLP